MKIIIPRLIFASACLLTSLGSLSEEIPDRGPIPFTVFDQDSSGFVTNQEFHATQSKRMANNAAIGRPMRGAAPSFFMFDTDKDGKLSPDELITGQKAHQEKRQNMRAGQDRGQSRRMGMFRQKPSFKDFDLNGDGKILEEEFNEARDKRMSRKSQHGDRKN